MLESRFRRPLNEGDVLFRQGDVGDSAYVVESGAVEVVLEAGPRPPQVLARLGAGAVLGELALVDRQVRSATVIAREPTVLRVITREYLDARMDAADPMLRHLVHLLADRFRNVVSRLAEVQPSVVADARDAADRVSALTELALQQEMEAALERGEFELHYQPIVRLRDRSVAGFEALIRWRHAERGMIPPSLFIPAAERSGLIVPMGRWIVQTAGAALAELDAVQRRGAPARAPLFISVNVSARQLGDAALIDAVAGAVARAALPHRLRLEITESALFDNIDQAAEFLERCRALGVELYVDDFGHGHSPLSYLYRLPVSGIKIDRGYIADLGRYPASAKVVGAMTGLADALDMSAIAEGIETAQQCAMARNLGLRLAQGFFFAPAYPLAQAMQYLEGPDRAGSWGRLAQAAEG